jgi:hypothetical protein
MGGGFVLVLQKMLREPAQMVMKRRQYNKGAPGKLILK